MRNESRESCSDCRGDVSRRDFLTTTAGAALAASTFGMLPSRALAAPTSESAAEVAVAELYATLTPEQRKIVALPMDDPRRTKINANWSITEAKVGSFSKSQQELIDKILRGITSEDGYERFIKQMADDNGGVEKYAIALFGTPGKGEFTFELTGRHLTLRADGNTVAGPAFGGPLVYGHGKKGNSDNNLFAYQTKQANKVFAALDSKQREAALLAKSPGEGTVELDGKRKAAGINVGSLSSDQQELVTETLRTILAPYRQDDIEESMAVIKAGGGNDSLHMAFYQDGDLDKDEVWDVWRIEGPTAVCHFRGAPHVHAYINIAQKTA